MQQAVTLYDPNGLPMSVQDGVVIPAGTSGPLLYGQDGGSTARRVTVSSAGDLVVDQGLGNSAANAWATLVTDGLNTLGVTAHPLRVDPTGTTTQPITGPVVAAQGAAGTASWPVAITADTAPPSLQTMQAVDLMRQIIGTLSRIEIHLACMSGEDVKGESNVH